MWYKEKQTLKTTAAHKVTENLQIISNKIPVQQVYFRLMLVLHKNEN